MIGRIFRIEKTIIGKIPLHSRINRTTHYFSTESPSERIVGGHPIKISHVPWQVSLKYLPYDVHTCGGSIISDQWILTAAHCLVDLQPRQILVNAGTTDSLVNGSIHEIASTTIHPCYKDFSLDKDFALIRLKVSLKFDEKIQLIQLADNNAPDGRKCLVTGWGIRSNTATVTEKLLRGTNVRIVNQQRCRQAYGMDHITSSMLCAGCLGVGRNDCR